jgi:hypothetical protein
MFIHLIFDFYVDKIKVTTYQIMISIYETRLFVCFLLFVVMRSTKLGCFRSRSWTLWKALENEGCMGLVP